MKAEESYHWHIQIILMIVLGSCNFRDTSLSVSLTGDVILDRGVSDELSIHGDTVLNQSMQSFLTADFNIINLETVLSKQAYPLKKGYYFKAEPHMASNLELAGITHASVANNHSFDFGHDGFNETISALEAYRIHPIGKTCEPEIVTKGNQSIGILAVSLTIHNEHLCIQESKSLLDQVDTFEKEHDNIPLVVYVHWGLEYQRTSEQWQRDLAYQLIDRGVDAIFGHHPHVFQNIEYYRDKPIVYSLGNFVADVYLPNTTQAVVATIRFEESKPFLILKPIKLESYFPEAMSLQEAITFLSENLKFNKDKCFYQVSDEWRIQEISEVSFQEEANNWLFNVQNEDQLWIKKLSDGTYRMSLINKGVIQKSVAIHGLLSEIEIANITNDEGPEILLGITKKVNFDRTEKKRLNVFRIEEQGIKAVWLGTRFLYDLQSYEVIETNGINYLHTLEKDSINQTYEVTYQWDEFGFALEEIKKRNEEI